MSGPGGISSNRPVNTGYTAPTQGAGQAKEAGMDLVQDLVLGGKVRTAQAQPPGKSFTETMGAAFTAMGAAVTSFFKGLGDRIATIEMPSLPRISLRRQEATQASPAPKGANMSPQLAAQLFRLENSMKDVTSHPERLAILVAPSANSGLGKLITEHAFKNEDLANLNFVRGLGTGISLGELREKYIRAEAAPIPGSGGFGMQQSIVSSGGADASLNLDSRLRQPLMASLDKAIAAGLSDVQVVATFNPETKNFEVTIEGSVPDPEMQSLMDGLQKNMQKAHSHVTTEMLTNSFGNTSRPNSLFHRNNAIMNEARNVKSEGVTATQNRNDAAQAEIGKLNAMSTPDFAEALRADPSLARHLPQMNPSGKARQEYENFVASQPPMSRQAATEGFYEMVRQSLLDQSLIEAGLVKEEPADNVEAAADFSNITGVRTTGAAPAGAASGLPQVALSSLGHLWKLPGGDLTPEQMNRLDAQVNTEFSSENMSFLRSGAALMNIQAADGSTRPIDMQKLRAGETVNLTADLPVIKQWAAHFVVDGAAQQVNVSSRLRTELENALSNMPDDAAAVTDSQKVALTDAMRNCFREIVSVVTRDSLPRAFP